MAKRFYEPISTDLKLWKDPQSYIRAELEAELVAIVDLQTVGLIGRAALSKCAGKTLEAYDDHIEAQRVRLADLIDFFDYSNTTINITVKDGAWFTPVAIESVCGEEVDHEIGLTIDGLNNTYWQHSTDEQHEIIWQLRDYKKRITKLRVRIGGSNRNLLTGLDIHIANSIGGLTNPNNLRATGVSLVVPNSWEEIVLDSKANGKYIRFSGFGSVHASNHVRIQEVQAWVTTVEYD